MSTLLDAQKKAISDIAIADAKKSIVVGVGAMVAGTVLVKMGHERTGAFTKIAAVAAVWWGAGQVNMANKIVEKV